MDLCLYARNHGVPAEQAAAVIGVTVEQVQRVFNDIDAKRRATRYLHSAALLIEPVMEVQDACVE
jgi:NAD+ synthase